VSESISGTLAEVVAWDRPDAPGFCDLGPDLKAIPVLNENHLINLVKDAVASGRRLLPAGGGRGGPFGPVGFDVVLDLRRQHRVIDWDGESFVVTVESGISIGQLGEQLALSGASLAGWRREHPSCTIGGLLSTWQPTPHGLWNGSVREACIGLGVVTGTGDHYDYVPAPRKASGPDLRFLFIGGEGAFGIIATATLGVSIAPVDRRALRVQCAEPATALAFLTQAQWNGLRCPNMLYSAAGGELHILLEGTRPTVTLMADVVRGTARRFGLDTTDFDPDAYYAPERGDLRAGADPVTGRAEGKRRAVALWGAWSTLRRLPARTLEAGVLYDIGLHHAALHVPADAIDGLGFGALQDRRAAWLDGEGAIEATWPAASAAASAVIAAAKAALDPAGILPRPHGWFHDDGGKP